MNSFLKGQEILIAKTAACHGNWSFKTVLGKADATYSIGKKAFHQFPGL